MNMKTRETIIILFLVLVLAGQLPAAVAQTTVYRGRLLDDDGNTVDTNSVQINFILYDALTGGNSIYEDRNSGVSVEGGVYRCVIGDDTTDYGHETTDYSAALADATHLEISIGGSTMSPREELQSQAYAIDAEFAPFHVDTLDYTTFVWTNMPSALTEISESGMMLSRTKIDLTNATQVRLTVAVLARGSNQAKIRLQYSTDQSTWDYLDGSSEPSVAIRSTGLQVSNWVDLEDDAKADVFLRIVGINGNGRRDPVFGLMNAQFR